MSLPIARYNGYEQLENGIEDSKVTRPGPRVSLSSSAVSLACFRHDSDTDFGAAEG